MMVGMVVCACEKDGEEEGGGRSGGKIFCDGQSVRWMRERIDVYSGESACRKDERRRERI